MFHRESWKLIYYGVKRSKVKVMRHKNSAGVSFCILMSAGFFFVLNVGWYDFVLTSNTFYLLQVVVASIVDGLRLALSAGLPGSIHGGMCLHTDKQTDIQTHSGTVSDTSTRMDGRALSSAVQIFIYCYSTRPGRTSVITADESRWTVPSADEVTGKKSRRDETQPENEELPSRAFGSQRHRPAYCIGATGRRAHSRQLGMGQYKLVIPHSVYFLPFHRPVRGKWNVVVV